MFELANLMMDAVRNSIFREKFDLASIFSDFIDHKILAIPWSAVGFNWPDLCNGSPLAPDAR